MHDGGNGCFRDGAIQKSHSCISAQPLTNIAGPVERAGLTDRLVTGMPIRWMSVRPRQMAMGANPCGARLSVAPRMINRNMNVRTNSATNPAISEYCPGECSP